MIYHLAFKGVYLKQTLHLVPASSGVYSVHAGSLQGSTFIPRELLYIGESYNVRSRLMNHDKEANWAVHLLPGEVLGFNYAMTSADTRVRTEAALIYHHQPPVNIEYKNSFPFPETTISASGKKLSIASNLSVSRPLPLMGLGLGRPQ